MDVVVRAPLRVLLQDLVHRRDVCSKRVGLGLRGVDDPLPGQDGHGHDVRLRHRRAHVGHDVPDAVRGVVVRAHGHQADVVRPHQHHHHLHLQPGGELPVLQPPQEVRGLVPCYPEGCSVDVPIQLLECFRHPIAAYAWALATLRAAPRFRDGVSQEEQVQVALRSPALGLLRQHVVETQPRWVLYTRARICMHNAVRYFVHRFHRTCCQRQTGTHKEPEEDTPRCYAADNKRDHSWVIINIALDNYSPTDAIWRV
mmetsp:Transcript_18226/g.34697  ORF Transcript_18226/g.34697 Transcript_18226/m.34697 type:complete len:256 (-) Transcript_18226:89-856(-)